MYRQRDVQEAYHDFLLKNKDTECIFCNAPEFQVVEDLEYFQVLKNTFPYYVWDFREVVDHLLLVPKRHVVTMLDLSDEEKKEYIEVMSQYEGAGYNLYTRTRGSKARSVNHIHTHLIKCSDREFVTMKYQKDPYLSEATFEDWGWKRDFPYQKQSWGWHWRLICLCHIRGGRDSRQH